MQERNSTDLLGRVGPSWGAGRAFASREVDMQHPRGPIGPAPGGRRSPDPPPPPPDPTPQPLVLLIDDAPAFARYLASYPSAHRYRVEIAGTATGGVRRALAERPDLIVLDHHLPEGDGLRTLRWLRSARATVAIPVIYLTGDERSEICR